jgi:hypothetical protein
LTVRHQIFESSAKSWEDLCQDATEFASQLGRESLINISLAADGGATCSAPAGTK